MIKIAEKLFKQKENIIEFPENNLSQETIAEINNKLAKDFLITITK